jgi:hypothetical protein
MKKEALKVRAEYKQVCSLPYEEEEYRVCEVKCLRAEGDNETKALQYYPQVL